MGLNFTSSIILYNRFYNATLETEYYYPTRFDNVRIELTQADNVTKSGIADADSIRVKIPQSSQLKPFEVKSKWDGLTSVEKEETFTVDSGNEDFFVIVENSDMNIHETECPIGVIDSEEYASGFFQYMKERFNTYSVKTLDVFNLIPRIEIGGA